MKNVTLVLSIFNFLNLSCQDLKSNVDSGSHRNEDVSTITDEEMKTSMNSDSIRIENSAEFYDYADSASSKYPALRLKVKITNLGTKPIPNLMRASNRIEHLKLLINNKNSNNLNISNGIEGDDWLWSLNQNESDSFETIYLLTKDSGIFQYGNDIVVSWKYAEIISKRIVIDLNKMEIKTIELGDY